MDTARAATMRHQALASGKVSPLQTQATRRPARDRAARASNMVALCRMDSKSLKRGPRTGPARGRGGGAGRISHLSLQRFRHGSERRVTDRMRAAVAVARLHIGVDSDLNHVIAAPFGSARSPWSTNKLQVRLQRAARLPDLTRPSPRVLGKLPQPCPHQRRACARAARLRSRPLPTRVNRLTAAPTSVSLAAAMAHVDESEP